MKLKVYERRRLVKRREAKRLKKREVAAACGLDPGTFSRLESGETKTVNALVLKAWRDAVA